MRVFPVMHWIVAGIGTILLLGVLGVSRAGSWIGGVTYVMSGVGVSEVFYPHIHPGMALLPWILWAVARPARSRGGRLLGLSLLFGLIFLAGDVFTGTIAIVACGLWVLLEEERAQRPGSLVLLVLAGLLGVLIALPQILATALWIPETNRGVLGMKLGDAFFFSVHPLRLLELVVPFPLGATWTLEDSDVWGWTVFHGKAMGLFGSLYAGAFAVVGLVVAWRVQRPGVRFSRALFVGALLFCVLPSLVPAAWERAPSPIPLRNPEKFAVAMTFGLAILAGIAFDRLRRSARRPAWTLTIGALIAVAAVLVDAYRHPLGRLAVEAIGGNPGLAKIAAERMSGALAEAGLLWIATVIAVELLTRPGRNALAASLVLLTMVPLAANRKIARTISEQEMFAPTPFVRFLERADPRGDYRVLGESIYRDAPITIPFANRDDEYSDVARRLWIYQTQVLWNRGTVLNIDFDVGDLSRLESLRRTSLLTERLESRYFFESLALKFGIRFRDQRPGPGYRPIWGDAWQIWDELDGALPHIRLVGAWTEEAAALAALDAMSRLGHDEIVVETGARRKGTARPGTVRIRKNLPDELVMDVEAPDPTWLFVLRGFWIHRTVELDGRPVEVVPAQVGFSAVRIPAGRHTVDWKERVPGGDVSRWGPLLAILLAAGLYARDRRTRRGS
jgi:hypothetical protein